jgi:hypothetical protein
MINIFISYRRDDSAGYTGRLTDSLEALVGSGNIFRDVEDISPGDNFVKAIEQNLQRAKVLLIVIGQNWLTAKDGQGLLRLQNPKDFVRLEIETALRLGHQIIPVLIDDALMPSPEELPESIAPIAYRQALVCTDTRWDEDINRLFKVLLQSQKEADKNTGLKRLLPVTFKKWRYLAIMSFLLVAVGALFWFGRQTLSVPDFSGNWYFSGGDYLLIKQNGDHFEVERIDPAMQTTYEKGAGIIKGRRLEFDLEPVFTDKFRYRGNLELAADKNQLHGKLIEVLSNQIIPVQLNRSNPAATQQ